MSHSSRSIWMTIGGVTVTAVIVLILYPLFAPIPPSDRRSDLAPMKQLAIGLLIYVVDYDDVTPPPTAWFSKGLMPYVKNEQLAKCVGLDHPKANEYGHALHRPIAEQNVKAIKNPVSTVTFFDSTDLTLDAVSEMWQLPYPGRLKGRNSFAFLDGHAKIVPMPTQK